MKIIVKYWRGTTQVTGTAKTYRGAMRLASQNQNTYQAKFYDEDGVQLFDDGHGLAYPDKDVEAVGKSGVTCVSRTYAV